MGFNRASIASYRKQASGGTHNQGFDQPSLREDHGATQRNHEEAKLLGREPKRALQDKGVDVRGPFVRGRVCEDADCQQREQPVPAPRAVSTPGSRQAIGTASI